MLEIVEFYKQQERPIWVNLGCRNKPLPHYINVDIDPDNKLADVTDNAISLHKFENESIDLIEAIHIFEHISLKENLTALKRWYLKLKPRGILRISVPDLDKAIKLYNWKKNFSLIKTMFYGSGNDEWDFHKTIYDKSSLTGLLIAAGFADIKEWDYWKTYPHNFCDSYASSVYPHMCKKYIQDNGRMIDLGGEQLSLNLEAIK